MSETTARADADRHAAEVEVLRRVSLEINTTLDLEEICGIVLRTMDDLFDFAHSVILLAEEEKLLRVVASRGYDDAEPGGTVPFGTGVIGVVAKRRRLMRVGNLGQQRAYMSTIRQRMEEAGRTQELGEIVPVPGLPDAESQVAIPMQVGDRLVGVFSVESRQQRTFSEHEELLVTIVANQAASAIRNAQLYADERRRRDELAQAHDRLQELNETLEDRVRERTRELEETNQELHETQAQLVQSDRMASLGMLASGVAHEINTPIGAIRAGADVVDRAAQILLDALEETDVARALEKHPRVGRALSSLRDTKESTLAATARVMSIIQSLKSFARLDEADFQSVDLHEGLDSALTLIRHLQSDGVRVVRDYGELPRVACFAAQVNQAFMNILTNAVQAMDGDGQISVRTRHDGDHVVVAVSDTGRGIPPDQLAHIFEPGFTTKKGRVGVGLGLPIAYRIVDEHGGTITVESQRGAGTTFTIRLPVTPPA